MKPPTGQLIVLLALILAARADDVVVAPQENPVASKHQTFAVLPSEGAPQVVIPANLRDEPANNIPFPQPASGFIDNPDPRPIKIAPMPDVLRPLGDQPMIKMTAAPKTESNLGTVDLPVRAVVEIPQASEKTPSAGVSQQTVTVSPFLDWIQNTRNAAEVARQQRQVIEQNDLREKGAQDGSDQDLFVHIRFPYVGNQDLPPTGGSVTYSVPQR